MKLIKVTTKDGKKAIANVANISYWYGINENETTIAFINTEDFLTVSISVDEFAQRLEAYNNSRIVLEF